MAGQTEFQVADVPAPDHTDPVPADDTAGELHTGTESEGHATSKGLPQLDTTTFASQLFWLLLTFVTLYLVMSRVALPKLEGVIAERKGRIKGDLDSAAQAKRDSEAAIAGYDKALADARAKALKSGDQMRNTVQAEINAKNDQASKQLAADTAKAEARIGEMRTAAMARVGDVARETAVDIVSKLTGETANANDLAAAVTSALKSTRTV
jgi:F-type H+-transporting ATPase subunit b